MQEDALTLNRDSALNVLSRISPICDAFEVELLRGSEPRIEDYLAQGSPLDRKLLLVELFKLDLVIVVEGPMTAVAFRDGWNCNLRIREIYRSSRRAQRTDDESTTVILFFAIFAIFCSSHTLAQLWSKVFFRSA